MCDCEPREGSLRLEIDRAINEWVERRFPGPPSPWRIPVMLGTLVLLTGVLIAVHAC